MTNGGGMKHFEGTKVERKEPKPESRKGKGNQVKRPAAGK
jgi:hypothetical protein